MGANHNISKPWVSVLMPVHNAASTIEAAIRSILDQDLKDYEFIIVDDGSTDSTARLIESWAEKDRRIRVFSQKRKGIIEALNLGLTQCSAKLIARMDADDLAHRKRLSKQVTFMEQNPELAVVGCKVKAFPTGRVKKGYQIYIEWLNSLITSDQIAREIFIESPIVHPSAMIKRSWIEMVGGYQDHGWPEDYDLWLRLHMAGAQFAKVPQVLLAWREYPERFSRNDSRYSVENFLRAKAHYLCQGQLANRDAVFVWGAGQMGRRISKHLLRNGAQLQAFLDIDPKKIGRTLRGLPILELDEFPGLWREAGNPALLAAVGSRGARALIRERLINWNLEEGSDWWAVA